jgi:hypothetical protein
MVALVELDRTQNPISTDLLEAQPSHPQELA